MGLKNVMTGNMALLKISGKTIGAGIVANANISDDLGLQDIDGLGTAESVELVVGAVKHTISLSKFFVVGQTLSALGYQPNSNSYLTSGALEIEILSNVDGTTLEHYTGVKLASSSRSYGKHAPTTEGAQFRALHKVK
jgi:hypothetical protein